MSPGRAPRVAVVTGASSGVGRAVAHAFARRGAAVGLIARGEAGLEASAGEVRRLGGTALILPADVTDHGQVESAAEAVERWAGPIDVWVNDAMATVFAPLSETTPDEFRRATEVTYLGTVHGTMAALRRMVPRDSGTVVQVGSALAYRAIPLQAAYCGAKFAVRGFTDSVRTELLHERSRVWISMVQLPAVNTPQFSWCRTRLPDHPQPVPPIFDPDSQRRRSSGRRPTGGARSSSAGARSRRSSHRSWHPVSPTATWPGRGTRRSRCRATRSTATGPTISSSPWRASPRPGAGSTFPRWHSDGLFSELIGGPGTYAVRPRGRCTWGGYYERGSLIWRSRWVTDEGIVECREALALPSHPGRAVVLRSIAVVAGRGSVSARLALAARFGTKPMVEACLDGGVWQLRSGGTAALWSGAAGARSRDGVLELELDLAEGDRHDLVLVLDEARGPDRPPLPAQAWSETEAAWAERVPGLEHVAATREARTSCTREAARAANSRGRSGQTSASTTTGTFEMRELSNRGGGRVRPGRSYSSSRVLALESRTRLKRHDSAIST